MSHLSKSSSDIKQKCTQLPTSFLGTVFHARVLGWEITLSKTSNLKVFGANTRKKMDLTMWKSMKNCAQKWCRSLCAFLFEATCAFGKMWRVMCKRDHSWSWNISIFQWIMRWWAVAAAVACSRPRCWVRTWARTVSRTCSRTRRTGWGWPSTTTRTTGPGTSTLATSPQRSDTNKG